MYWKRGKLLPRLELKNLYLRNRINKKDIMKYYNCSIRVVNRSISEYNFDNLFDRYIVFLFNKGLRQDEIAEKVKRDQAAISRRLNILGVDCVTGRISRTKETVLERYGVDNIQKSPHIREQQKQTCLNKYGVDTPLKIHNCHHTGWWEMHGDSVIRSNKRKAYSNKEYFFPSGRCEIIQGYEGFALDILLQSYNENDIIVNSSEIPVIKYNDNGKPRNHYPDIFIPKDNMIIEVKSTFTKQVTKNLMKKYYKSKELGYRYEIWVFNQQKELVEVI